MKNYKTILLIIAITIGTILHAQESGKASYYSKNLHGEHTSDGGLYNSDSLTCAHNTYDFGTLLLVQNPKNGNQTIVKVTDRGPHTRNRLIDVSYQAARELGMISDGIASVIITKITVLPDPIRLLQIPSSIISISPLQFLKSETQRVILKSSRLLKSNKKH